MKVRNMNHVEDAVRRIAGLDASIAAVELINGTIGYRQSPDKVEVSKDTAELLAAAGLDHCVKVSREPVKAALKNMDAEMLERFHARVVPGKETFYVSASAQVIPA